MAIIIYFDKPGKMDYPFDNQKYYESYRAFANFCKSRGVQVYFCRGEESYSGNMEFSSGYMFIENSLVFKKNKLKANIIYVKGYNLNLGEGDIALNHPEMAIVCRDKMRTYREFKKYMSPTFEIDTKNYKDILNKIESKKIVVKPIFGSEGKGIYIIEKKEFSPDLLKNPPYFVQQFIDSSNGIPGVLKGLHDLRLLIFNGELKLSWIRQPKKGSYLANIAQGGKFVYVSVEELPDSVFKIAYEIDKRFQAYSPRFYAIDVIFEKGKMYLLELNDQPGLPYLEEDKYDMFATRFFDNLFDVLTSIKQS